MKKRHILKAASFIVVFFLLLAVVSTIFVVPGADYRTYQWVRGIYEERENALDAVYIGASNVYSTWVPALAWNKYGIAVYGYAIPSLPFEATEYLIEEARKTQPDALYIVNTNIFYSDFTPEQIHEIVDYFPNNLEKHKLIQRLTGYGDYTFADTLEFYFPLIRYHTRWNELTKNDFTYEPNGYKGSRLSSGFCRTIVDVSASWRETDRREEPPAPFMESLDSLLEYCTAENVKVLFTTTGNLLVDETMLAQCNYFNDYIREKGFTVLNMRDAIDEIGLDLSRDFYNEGHNNIHGGIKVTDYLSRYLIDHYGFTDKRGDPAYSDWDEGCELFREAIAPLVCDFEYNMENRDYSLKAPELTKLSVSGTKLTLTWKGVPNATGYCVYRREQIPDEEVGPLELIADVDAKTLSYVDKNCVWKNGYAYTVASYREEDGIRYWGTYDFTGLGATAALYAPSELKTEGTRDNLTLSWNAVPGAAGYWVSRRVVGKSWINQEDVGAETSYTDTEMLEAMPYQYRVRAYWYNEKEEPVYGSWSAAAFYLPELDPPEVSGELEEGVPVLNWGRVEGITGYKVYRTEPGGDWEQISEPLNADATRFRDISAEKGTAYRYKVEAYLSYGKDTYSYPSEEAALTAEAGPVALKPPEILFCEQVGNAVQLVWEPAENATAYRIWRQAEGAEDWTVAKASVGGSSYQEKPGKAGSYRYFVQTLRTEDGALFSGSFPPESGQSVDYTP